MSFKGRSESMATGSPKTSVPRRVHSAMGFCFYLACVEKYIVGKVPGTGGPLPLVLGDSFRWDVGHRCVENEQVCGRCELFNELRAADAMHV